MVSRTGWALLVVLFSVQSVIAQTTPLATLDAPDWLDIRGLRVVGISDEGLRLFIRERSGLRIGQVIAVPGDPALANAIRTLYKFRDFADVKILEERRSGSGIHLVIQVEEQPRLVSYTFEGVKKGQRKDLQRTVPLLAGTSVHPSDIAWSRQIVETYFQDRGYLLADVQVRRETPREGAVSLAFVVERGPRVEVGPIVFEGNQALSDRRLRKQMEETKQKGWWKLWGKNTFDQAAYEDDLDRLVAYYHEQGYYDTRLLQDTVYVRQDGKTPEIVVEIGIYEGPRYYIREVTWDGNTLYTDDALTQALGFARGDPYNGTKLEQNLVGNPRGTDVASLYLNRGYMRFNAQPTVQVVDGDSLDLHFDVFESSVYTFGEITIAGNQVTNDAVIRRELYTTPGQTFSRSSIQESIRRLVQLNYFDQTSLAAGPEISVDDEGRSVDLTYTVEETFRNPFSIAGSAGGSGLLLQVGLTHNNFSLKNLFAGKAWNPLPSGDGQQFALSVQSGGRDFQRYSLSFTEPWFQGRPTPLGFAVSHTRIKDDFFADTDTGTLRNTSARVFYDRRLPGLDDKLNLSSSLRYQHYNNAGWTASLPLGVSREIVFREALTRNALDHPVFPTRGSLTQLSVEVAPPFPGFTQYHKWRLQTNWNIPLAKQLTFGVATDFGYVGSLTGEEVDFQRFVVGGSPFETQGISDLFGRDIIYLRGYPLEAIGPRQGETAIGGRILNKYSAEIRWHALRKPQLTAVPYLFFDAANTWNNTSTYSPTNLFRSAGMGLRLQVPILGLVDLNYGYNFDPFSPIDNHDGTRGWTFQLSLGRSFNLFGF